MKTHEQFNYSNGSIEYKYYTDSFTFYGIKYMTGTPYYECTINKPNNIWKITNQCWTLPPNTSSTEIDPYIFYNMDEESYFQQSLLYEHIDHIIYAVNKLIHAEYDYDHLLTLQRGKHCNR